MNKLFLWNDTSIYIGDSLETDYHQHHAVQCCIALTGQLRVRSNKNEEWQLASTAIIGSNISHSITNPDGPVCFIYLEKLSNNYHSILDYHCLKQQCEIKSQPLISSYSIPDNLIARSQYLQSVDMSSSAKKDLILNKEINDFKELCLILSRGYMESNNNVDARISQLLKILNDDEQESFRGDALANTVGLSESRMQHLFKQQVGIPIRRYILWTRLKNVIKQVVSGGNLTDAAYRFGFSDSAHFSRTFRSTFGTTASSILINRDKLQTMFM